jgi:hypothetical protein
MAVPPNAILAIANIWPPSITPNPVIPNVPPTNQ